REVADEDRYGDLLARPDHEGGRPAVADEVGPVQLVGPHAGDELVVAEGLGRAVVVDEPVVLPLDVRQLGVDVALDLRLAADQGGQVAAGPGAGAVAAAGRHAPILRVDEGRGALNLAGAVVKRAARLGPLDDLVDVPGGCGVVVDVEVPGVQVGARDVVVVA